MRGPIAANATNLCGMVPQEFDHNSDEVAAVVERALAAVPVIDGHNDWAWECRINRDYSVADLDRRLTTNTDIPRLFAGRVGAQFWSVYVSDELAGAQAVQATLEQIDWVYRLAAHYPDTFEIARSAADVTAAHSRGAIGSLMGAEGAHSIDNSPAVLRMFARLGVRYMTLTHVHNTDWADSATDTPQHAGLSERGIDFIREMNRLGMLVDLSHVATATMHAALDSTDSPVIFSHSSCRDVSDHPRNVPNDVLERLENNGGVQMITFAPQFLSQEYAAWHASARTVEPPAVTVSDVADHVEHAREVAGERHVGLGGDFDGTDAFPDGLDGVDRYPALLAELANRGWSSEQLAALAGGNILRVLEATDSAFARAGSDDPYLVV